MALSTSSSASVNSFDTTVAAVRIFGTTTIESGSGTVSLAGRATGATGVGLAVNGSGSNGVSIAGHGITLTGERALGGTIGGAIYLSNARIGSAAETATIALRASGFDGTATGHGSVLLAPTVTFAGQAGAVLSVASDIGSAPVQAGGTTATSSSGLWIAGDSGSGTGGAFGTLLRAATGMAQVTIGDALQSGVTSVQNLALTTWKANTTLDYDLAIEGGSGGITVSGASNDVSGLAAGRHITLSSNTGATIGLGTSTFKASELRLAAAQSEDDARCRAQARVAVRLAEAADTLPV